MSGASAALTGRAAAERQMTSTLRYFDLGDPVTDASTGEVTRPEANPHTAKCRVRPATLRDYHSMAGGEELFASNYVVAIPFGQLPAPQVKQHCVIESSPDPALVGIELQIRQVAYGDHLTARRMLCFKVS